MRRAGLLLLFFLSSVLTASESVPLETILQQFQKTGSRVIFSDALVKPEMRVRALSSPPSSDAIGAALAAHGLQLRPGPAGAWVVVKAPNTESRPGVVSFIKVVSDKIEDVSSLDAVLKSFIKPGMTDADKAMAIWRAVVKFRHQDSPPSEYLQESGSVQDAIKSFNVYGYGQCSCSSAMFLSLARAAGLKARGWGLHGHSVPEVFYDDAWHMLDPSLMTYFPKADSSLASVAEISAGVDEWLTKKRPTLKGAEDLARFMRNGNWRRSGPEILARCPTMHENGWFPAGTHGWYSALEEYAKPSELFVYEYGYSEGYQVNIQLRPGESVTRNWSNSGLHVNMDSGGNDILTKEVGKGDLGYAKAYGDLAPGRVGNGVHEYDVPLANGAFRSGALECENLACRSEDLKSPALHVKEPSSPGVYVLRMASSYVYLTGELAMRAIVGEGGEVAVLFSDNNGLAWKEVSKLNVSGDQKIDLRPFVFRRYDYRLKFVLRGKGTGIDALKIRHDIQHSQRALPALAQGANTISFSAGPAESTLTLEGHFNPEWKNRNVYFMDYEPALKNMDGYPLRVQGPTGEIVFPLRAPNDIVRLRCGAHYRIRDDRDTLDLQVSFDEGKTWKPMGRMPGPTPGHSEWLTFTDIPPGTRSARIKYAMQQRNTACIFGFRIDADYKEIHGGYRPVKVSYEWTEDGVEKRDERIMRSPRESYTINCGVAPLMRSIRFELAD